MSAETETRGSPRSGPWIDVDPAGHDPWRVRAVRHRVHDHPLLAMPSLIALGQRLETSGRIRKHSSGATPDTPFNTAPGLHPHRRSALETLGDIEHASAWMSLLNIQSDPTYRALVDDVVGSIRPAIESSDPGVCYRAGWIFVTSPRTITPFHMDKEHNFILQVRGSKRIWVWEPDDTEAVSEAARDLFHDIHSRDLVRWRDDLKARAHVFDVAPGMGIYMPSTAPHLVENGNGPSVTISFTYYTDATRRDSLLHRVHNRLRRLGVTPPPVGALPWLDAATVPAGRLLLAGHSTWRALRRRPVARDDAYFAEQLVA